MLANKKIMEFGDNNEDFDRDDGFEEGQEYLPEYGWWKRAAPLRETASFGEKYNVTDPVQRFLLYCTGVIKQFSDANVVKLNQDEIDEMLRRAKTVKNVAYKNPTAFVLAYVVAKNSRENRSLQKELVDSLWNRASSAIGSLGNVTKVDLVRYVRLTNALLYR